MNRLIISLVAACIFCFTDAVQAEDKFWSDNKITPSQPFPGKISAVATLWPGYDLIIEEIGGNRICLARVWVGHPLEYTILDPSKGETKEKPKAFEANGCWTYLSPAIDINRFSWSIGAWTIGPIFGENDLLRKVVAQSK